MLGSLKEMFFLDRVFVKKEKLIKNNVLLNGKEIGSSEQDKTIYFKKMAVSLPILIGEIETIKLETEYLAKKLASVLNIFDLHSYNEDYLLEFLQYSANKKSNTLLHPEFNSFYPTDEMDLYAIRKVKRHYIRTEEEMNYEDEYDFKYHFGNLSLKKNALFLSKDHVESSNNTEDFIEEIKKDNRIINAYFGSTLKGALRKEIYKDNKLYDEITYMFSVRYRPYIKLEKGQNDMIIANIYLLHEEFNIKKI